MPYIRRSPDTDGPFLSCCCEGKSGGSLWNEFDKQLLFSLLKAIELRPIIFRKDLIQQTFAIGFHQLHRYLPPQLGFFWGLNRKNPTKIPPRNSRKRRPLLKPCIWAWDPRCVAIFWWKKHVGILKDISLVNLEIFPKNKKRGEDV